MLKPSHVRGALIAGAIGILFGVPLGCAGYTVVHGIVLVSAFAAIASCFCVYALPPFKRKTLVAVALCAGLFLGYARSMIVMHVPSEYAHYFDSHSELLADIVSEPQEKNGYLQMDVRAVGLRQNIIVRMPISANPRFGQEVVLSGTMHAPQPIDAFDYPDYPRSKGITATESMPHAFTIGEMNHGPLFLAQSFGYSIQAIVSKRMLNAYEISRQPFLKALMFGDRSDFAVDESEPFIRTGTIHLIAVSGFKLTILLLTLQYVLQPFIPRKWLIAVTLVISGLYASVFAFDPPVVRAAAMSSLFIITETIGGGYEPASLLVLLAGMFAYMNPAAESFDSSMLFSVLGVLGIVVLSPHLKKIFRNIPHIELPLKFLAPAAGAYLLTLPLSLYWYGEISLLMPLTALCIMPLFEPSIVLGYVSAVPIMGRLAAAINQPIITYMSWAIMHLSSFWFAVIPLHIPGYGAYGVYLIATMCFWYLALKKPQGSATLPALPTQPAL